MSYSFVPHVARLVTARADQATRRSFVLINIAQLPEAKRLLKLVVQAAEHRLLFANCFAESALPLSPVLLELPVSSDAASEQIVALDSVLRQLPVLSILQTAMTLDELTQHLRSLLIIEADGSPSLLRLADTQMLSAVDSVLQPAQRARLFNKVDSWWTVDHESMLTNLCTDRQTTEALPILPLQLDAAQISALLTAVIVPTLASQMRSLSNTFATHLTHARQTGFVSEAVSAARSAGITDDGEMTAWTIARWEVFCEGQGPDNPA